MFNLEKTKTTSNLKQSVRAGSNYSQNKSYEVLAMTKFWQDGKIAKTLIIFFMC